VEAVEVGMVHTVVDAAMKTLALTGVIGVARVLVTATGPTRPAVTVGAARSSSSTVVPAAVVDPASGAGFGSLDERKLARADEGETGDGCCCFAEYFVHGHHSLLTRRSRHRRF
jgi:hypothetical protein